MELPSRWIFRMTVPFKKEYLSSFLLSDTVFHIRYLKKRKERIMHQNLKTSKSYLVIFHKKHYSKSRLKVPSIEGGGYSIVTKWDSVASFYVSFHIFFRNFCILLHSHERNRVPKVFYSCVVSKYGLGDVKTLSFHFFAKCLQKGLQWIQGFARFPKVV